MAFWVRWAQLQKQPTDTYFTAYWALTLVAVGGSFRAQINQLGHGALS